MPSTASRAPRRTVGALVACLAVAVTLVAAPAQADDTTVSYDTLRTGWDPNEPDLNAADASASDFGQLFATQLDGQVYAQPVVANGDAARRHRERQGLRAGPGHRRDPLDPRRRPGLAGVARSAAATSSRTSASPATPVVRPGARAPRTSPPRSTTAPTATTRTGTCTRSTSPPAPSAPASRPRSRAAPTTTRPRRSTRTPPCSGRACCCWTASSTPGFASHCDYRPVRRLRHRRATPRPAQQTAMWSTEAGIVDGGRGHLAVRRRPGVRRPGPDHLRHRQRRLAAPRARAPRRPDQLAESVVRLQVNADGTLTAHGLLLARSTTPTSTATTPTSAPAARWPSRTATAPPPTRTCWSRSARTAGSSCSTATTSAARPGPGRHRRVLQTAGPVQRRLGPPGVLGRRQRLRLPDRQRRPAVGVQGRRLRQRAPALTATGTSAATCGYTSGFAGRHLDGTTAGSALVWAVYSTGRTAPAASCGPTTRCPRKGTLTLRYSAPIGTATKFAVPATDDGRVYVGNRDGQVFGFGRPDHGRADRHADRLRLGRRSAPRRPGDGHRHRARDRHASRAVTTARRSPSTAVGAAGDPDGRRVADGPGDLPPDERRARSRARCPSTTSAGPSPSTCTATGRRTGCRRPVVARLRRRARPAAASPRASTSPTPGRRPRRSPAPPAPAAPFAATSLPAAGQHARGRRRRCRCRSRSRRPRPAAFTRAAGGHVVDRATSRVPLTGTGVAGAPHLTITPTDLDFGTVPVGQVGDEDLRHRQHRQPAAHAHQGRAAGGAVPRADPVSEGQQLAPGDIDPPVGHVHPDHGGRFERDLPDHRQRRHGAAERHGARGRDQPEPG